VIDGRPTQRGVALGQLLQGRHGVRPCGSG
jgi:hypothetical protein